MNAFGVTTGNVGTASSAMYCGRHIYDPATVRLARGSNQHRKSWRAPCVMCGKAIIWKGRPPKHWRPAR